MEKKRNQIFTTLVLLILIFPLACTFLWPTTGSTEKRELAPAPALIKDGSVNPAFLQDAGKWYEDHFAFRPEMVNAYNSLENALFQESGAQKVIMGKDGWLFYQETMDDYMGLNPLTDRQMFNIVHNLELMRYAVESAGSRFLVMIVPNKNTVYPQYMKERYIQAEEPVLSRFNSALEKAGLPYVDLAAVLLNSDEDLYFHQDTHWNSKGALAAYNAIMETLGLEHETYSDAQAKSDDVHRSDLAEILYPAGDELEADSIYDADYQTLNDAADYMADWIETRGQGDTDLLMYRDSFAEALIPFVASALDQGWFTRLVPYNLLQVESLKPDIVVIERAERRIASFQESACIMNMPVVRLPQIEDDSKESGTIDCKRENSFVLFSGQADLAGTDDQLYLEVRLGDGTLYQYPVFYIDDGYQVYLPASLFQKESDVSLIEKSGQTYTRIAEKEMESLNEENS